jgi:hypothetical protein
VGLPYLSQRKGRPGNCRDHRSAYLPSAGMHPFELRSKGGASSIENLANAQDQKLSAEPI